MSERDRDLLVELDAAGIAPLDSGVQSGLFAGFGSFPITLRADATGKSEVYWK